MAGKNTDYFPPPVRRKPTATDRIRDILSDWYGCRSGLHETTRFMPETESVGSAVDKLIKKFPNSTYSLASLKADWGAIVGPQVERVTRPLVIKDGILSIEVFHSAWMMELNSRWKDEIFRRICEKYGKAFCKSVRLVPSGRDTEGPASWRKGGKGRGGQGPAKDDK